LLVLVASTRSCCFDTSYSARVMATLSAATTGLTVSVADFVIPPAEAEIVTAVEAVTPFVVTVNVVLVAPAGTVTLAGTVATAVLLLERVTTVPPAGAGALRVTVPCEVLLPITLVGLSVNEKTLTVAAAGFTVSIADCVTPPAFAEIVTGVEAVTAMVVT